MAARLPDRTATSAPGQGEVYDRVPRSGVTTLPNVTLFNSNRIGIGFARLLNWQVAILSPKARITLLF
jgi:hypothetical protein